MTTISGSAEEALSYLKKTKPLGGWNIESKGGAVRLLRRKIPITDSYFLDIHHDPVSDCVVGILSKPKIGNAQGQILVDQDGKPSPASKTQIITLKFYDPNKKSTPSARSSTPPSNAPATTSATSSAAATATISPLTAEENKQLLMYAMYAIVAALFLKALTQAMATLSLLLVPILYCYALQTCPSEASFDAKKELRQILQGSNLPDTHPDKPKNFFDRTLASIGAAITTELATGLGYTVEMLSIAGAAWFTTVKVTNPPMEFFWIGAFSRWTYVYSRKVED